ncbi:hypothetical protein AAFF_G00434460 [Aldrovandia affinis]|uniref:Uncharacterized protein n=1 Tax=Aldrovandia affinis TaxID=143900 RepID=A0AAD7S842_9TELE|nr:hypothetical protein AAFF_G00434460 [Aldrovandia affinis]
MPALASASHPITTTMSAATTTPSTAPGPAPAPIPAPDPALVSCLVPALASEEDSAAGPPPVPVLDKENSTGGEEAAFPGGMSPELFSSPSGTVAAGPGEGAMSPSMERAASHYFDSGYPREWGTANGKRLSPRGKGAVRGQEHPRGNKSAPAVPLTNRFEALAGTGGRREAEGAWA